jgi:septum formation protein
MISSERQSQLQLILASMSPRRISLLKNLGLEFEVIPSGMDEIVDPALTPEQVVAQLAEQKAQDVFAQIKERINESEIPFLIIAADTMVVLNGKLLGKPTDREDAIRMLEGLSGNSHEVQTGVAVVRAEKTAGNSGIKKSMVSLVENSKVTFRPLKRSEIEAYVDTGEPMDKAGAYALQGIGAALVSKIDGSDSNVIGLPVARTVELLRRSGMVILGL